MLIQENTVQSEKRSLNGNSVLQKGTYQVREEKRRDEREEGERGAYLRIDVYTCVFGVRVCIHASRLRACVLRACVRACVRACGRAVVRSLVIMQTHSWVASLLIFSYAAAHLQRHSGICPKRRSDCELSIRSRVGGC